MGTSATDVSHLSVCWRMFVRHTRDSVGEECQGVSHAVHVQLVAGIDVEAFPRHRSVQAVIWDLHIDAAIRRLLGATQDASAMCAIHLNSASCLSDIPL